ncbi:MAG TPA: glycosyltransferase [Thermoanaerobaculia bacterium]|nr:glycosyltransferase [Thermoanaerobaculia bacterium]
MTELRTPHLLHVLPTFVPAGLEMRTVNLIAGFGAQFRHSILSMDGRTDAVDRLPEGAPVRILPGLPMAGSLATARRLRELLRSVAPDLVLTYNWGAFDMLLAARSLGFRRVVHHEDGFNADEAETFKRRRNLARQLVLPGVYRLIVPSDRLFGIATRLWKVPAGQITLIRNGIRLDGYGPADGNLELRRELGIPEDAPVIGAVGHLRPEKRFDRLLDACAALDPAMNVHVLIVGEGEMRPQLEERAARPDLAGRVHLAGYRPDPERFYRAMDLFSITSDTEQMPVCLLEAMATGLPVVCTDVGDIRTVLPSEQTAHLVPLNGEDPSETIAGLARHLAALLRDPAGRQRLARLNRRRVEESFTFEDMCAAYREVYHSALCAGGARGAGAEPATPEEALC